MRVKISRELWVCAYCPEPLGTEAVTVPLGFAHRACDPMTAIWAAYSEQFDQAVNLSRNLSGAPVSDRSQPVSDSLRQDLDRSENLSGQVEIPVFTGTDRFSAPAALDPKDQAAGQVGLCACGQPVKIKKSGECSRCYNRRKSRERYARVERAEGRHVCPACGSSARGGVA